MTPRDRRFLASIRNRLVIAFLTVTTIPVVVLSIYSAHSHLKALERMAFDAAAEEANLRARKLQNALGGAQSDLLYLSQIPSLDAFIEVAQTAEVADVDYVREKLAAQFETFVASRGTYRAAAYFDGAGRGAVFVKRVGTTASVVRDAEVARSPAYDDVLRSGGHLLAGQTLTRVDTSTGDPVVHFVARMFPRGMRRRGFVLLEMSLSQLWEADQAGERSATRIVVLDDARRPILGDAAELTPEMLVNLEREPNRPVETQDGRILTYVPIFTNPPDSAVRWVFVAIEPSAVVFRALTRYRMVFTLVLGATLVGAAGISVLLARQFTRPLERLYAAAQEIGHGRFDVDLEDQTGDEIGGLARELRAMADQLRIKHDDMQQQIDAKTRELLQAERLSTIGTMSAAIAHEVNNPLGIISMYSQMLSEQMPPDDPRAPKLRTIAREASRISGLVRGLLQFTQRSELNVTRVDLAALIEEAVQASLGPEDRADRIRVEVPSAGDCREIEADGDQLMQVFRNLIVNALHATSDGGTVTVSVGDAGEEHVAVCVSDTGRGIDPEHLPRLFEPFFTTRRFGTGTGLGLAISKEIVERHGGAISVSSVRGEGTVFTVRLPRRQRGV